MILVRRKENEKEMIRIYGVQCTSIQSNDAQ